MLLLNRNGNLNLNSRSIEVQNKKTVKPIAFRANLIVGCKCAHDTPLNKDFFGLVGQFAEPINEIMLARKARMHESIIRAIKRLQESRGPLRPSLPGDSCCCNLEKIDCGIPRTLSERYRRLDNALRIAEMNSWKKAGEELYNRHKTEIDALSKSISATDIDNPKFIKEIIKMNNFLGQGMEMEINLESGRLSDLAKSKEPVIFLFNHPAPPYDLGLSFGFVSQLYKKYSELGLAANCPRPKYILSERILSSMPEKLSSAFQKVQAVGINAGTYPTPERAGKNGNVISDVVNGFIRGKNNIFIFPEGGRARYQNLPIEERFQYGIGKIATKVLSSVGRAKVVNVALGYKDGHGVVYIGKPIIFEATKNGEIGVKGGNVSQCCDKTVINRFYSELKKTKGETLQPLTNNGVPITLPSNLSSSEDKKMHMVASRLMTGIMCDNMSICLNNVQKKLAEKSALSVV